MGKPMCARSSRMSITHLDSNSGGGGVIVTSGPDLLFLKDTDGDDQADVRYPILQGLGTADTHHAANNLVYGRTVGFTGKAVFSWCTITDAVGNRI